MPQIIDKMADIWKVSLGFSQCQKWIDKGSWISWTLVTRLRHYKLLFGSFTEFDVISEKRLELSRKWRTPGKPFYTLNNAKKSVKVPEYVRHWYHDSKIISSNILQVLLRLPLCRKNASNYGQNDKFLETCFFINKLVVGNSFRYFNNNQRKSLVTKDNMKFSRICLSFEFVWIIIHKRFICFKDSAFWNRGNNN